MLPARAPSKTLALEKSWNNMGIYESKEINEMQEHISLALSHVIDTYITSYPPKFQQQITYQLGLEKERQYSLNRGKRLRPLFVLLSYSLFESNWQKALPGAAAVELLHNFSLVHDDIQDGSETRRGRDSVWKIWGIPQAINAGDALLNLAYLSIFDLQGSISDNRLNSIVMSLQKTCLELTNGQYLDMSFEFESSISIDEYLHMIEGKTASLLSVCFKVGAIIAEAEREEENKLTEAGRLLGLAFQIQDDYLGIWGNEKQTGKSVYTDLMNRKKTLPIIMGINSKGEFSKYWNQSKDLTLSEAKILADLLDQDNIKERVIQEYQSLYEKVLEKIDSLSIDHQRSHILRTIIQTLEKRDK